MALADFDLREVAAACGMTEKRRRWGPCQACGKAVHSDGRHPVLMYNKAWSCPACGSRGDAISLACLHLLGNPKPRGSDFKMVLGWLESGEISPPKEVEPEPIVRIDPTEALRAACPLSSVSDLELDAWLARRHISRSAPAGWLRGFEATWWPGYDRHWPVVIPACTGRGEVVSMHGIAVSDASRKTTWPRGASARELLFAAPNTRRWMSGKEYGGLVAPARLLIVEGGTDYLSASTSVREVDHVIGLVSGGARALRLLPSLDGVSVFVGTDPDPAGDRYAREVAENLHPHPVRRLDLGTI